MYEYMRGELTDIAPHQVVLNLNGIGYLLGITLITHEEIKEQKYKKVKLYVHHHVREDTQLLFGFADKLERDCFRLLINIQGVGVNTAKLILSKFNWSELRTIALGEDEKTMSTVKGIGPKSAKKIIIDLKDHINKLEIDDTQMAHIQDTSSQSTFMLNKAEAIAALETLGYKRSQVEKVVNTYVLSHPDAKSEDIIKVALGAI